MSARIKTPWGWLGVIVAAGLFLRLGLIFWGPHAGSPETFEYDQLAHNLLSGAGYVYTHHGTVYRSFYSGLPYIGLTVSLYAVFPPGHTAVLVAQSLISSGLAIVVWVIGRWLANTRTGLLAALLTVGHPALVYYDTHKLHPLSLDALLISLVVLAFLWALGSRRALAPLLSGLVLGLAALQRGSLVLLVPMALLWLWWFGPEPRRALSRAAWCLVGIALVVGPWVTRNFLIHGTPLMLTTTGEHFWLGNVAHSQGSNLLPSGRTVIGEASKTFRRELSSRDEWGQSSLFWESALARVRAHPGEFLAGFGRKFLRFWTFGPQTGVRYPRAYFYLYMGYYLVIAVLAIAGVCGLLQLRAAQPVAVPALVLILAMCGAVSIMHSAFYFELRHRWVLEPLLLVLASSGAWSLWGWRRQGRPLTVGYSS